MIDDGEDARVRDRRGAYLPTLVQGAASWIIAANK